MKANHVKARCDHAKPPVFGVYATLVIAFSAFVILDTFVLQRTYAMVETNVEDARERATQASAANTTDANPSQTNASSDTSVSVWETSYLDTSVHVVDVYAQDTTNLLAAFADDAYGHNVSDVTSAIAEDHNALVAINGDCYGMRQAGYVVRNGVLYRSESAGSSQEDLVIYADGRFEIVREGEVTAEELVEAGAWQVFCFGPGLVSNGSVCVDANDEVGRAKASNPRTAIGKVEDGHYVLVVSDGRTNESEGLSLLELAMFMHDELHVSCAYNLDGGGSSTMWYDGAVVNNPTSSGRTIKERSVTDIVYLAN